MSDTTTMTDPREIFARGFATARTVLDGVGADQFDLPTPCDRFDVRALAGHLLAVAQRVRNVGWGQSPFSVPEVVEGVADDAWVTTWDEVGVEVAEAWADDEKLDRIVELPWATIPGGATLIMWTNELTVHAWDLATATGQRVDWDDEVVATAFAAMQVGLPAEGRAESFEEARKHMPEGAEDFEHPFKAAVELPEGASLIDQLVAWNGRDPR